MHSYGNTIDFVLRIGIGATFAWAGFAKILWPMSFGRSWGWSGKYGTYATVTIGLLELAVASNAVLGVLGWMSGYLTIAAVVVVTIGYAIRIASGAPTECGCFRSPKTDQAWRLDLHLTSAQDALRPGAIGLRNAVLMAIAIPVVGTYAFRRPPILSVAWTTTLAVGIMAIVLVGLLVRLFVTDRPEALLADYGSRFKGPLITCGRLGNIENSAATSIFKQPAARYDTLAPTGAVTPRRRTHAPTNL
jgi:hypothetical protein